MRLTLLFRASLRVLAFAAMSVPFFLYGAFVLVGLLAGVLRSLPRLLAAFRPSLRCAHGHEVPVRGRFGCATCKTEYLGWIGRCPTCGDGADLTRCPECRVGVRLPWEQP